MQDKPTPYQGKIFTKSYQRKQHFESFDVAGNETERVLIFIRARSYFK